MTVAFNDLRGEFNDLRSEYSDLRGEYSDLSDVELDAMPLIRVPLRRLQERYAGANWLHHLHLIENA